MCEREREGENLRQSYLIEPPGTSVVLELILSDSEYTRLHMFKMYFFTFERKFALEGHVNGKCNSDRKCQNCQTVNVSV